MCVAVAPGECAPAGRFCRAPLLSIAGEPDRGCRHVATVGLAASPAISNIEMAVAGFAEEDLDIEYADNVLTVSSKESEPFKDSTEPEYVHKGIAVRKFTKKFSLADDVVVNDASMKNGMLTISMEKVVPEGKKKRSIKFVSE